MQMNCFKCDKELEEATHKDQGQPYYGGELQLAFTFGSTKFDNCSGITYFNGYVCDDCAEEIVPKLKESQQPLPECDIDMITQDEFQEEIHDRLRHEKFKNEKLKETSQQKQYVLMFRSLDEQRNHFTILPRSVSEDEKALLEEVFKEMNIKPDYRICFKEIKDSD